MPSKAATCRNDCNQVSNPSEPVPHSVAHALGGARKVAAKAATHASRTDRPGLLNVDPFAVCFLLIGLYQTTHSRETAPLKVSRRALQSLSGAPESVEFPGTLARVSMLPCGNRRGSLKCCRRGKTRKVDGCSERNSHLRRLRIGSTAARA